VPLAPGGALVLRSLSVLDGSAIDAPFVQLLCGETLSELVVRVPALVVPLIVCTRVPHRLVLRQVVDFAALASFQAREVELMQPLVGQVRL
jgi:hypothetical protein